ncbi:hypothetical protein JE299_004268 [Salmonella enterica]|uniref:hypothetical protein n=1 Tax=Salmonella enterica TaxID=28901 RepID=UPI00127007A7|nr:hypothetical protein [Salmonella enterica]ECI5768908.1 hypothetical protein [Salmonella enterica subsp. enterica]EDL3487803.1 hypothetical protein [Salmonella enterica subsp. enterica serovar Newport]EDR6298192.1 hypothetical protein [Salmonella enterica subsp. enterica serovar Berkeley]EDV1505774.1 hypothetical protein [Salmonella enterica subsp. salamae]EIP0100323.1 hypothetical protein [Salmonella enterica subsp. enterica serovar Wangata]
MNLTLRDVKEIKDIISGLDEKDKERIYKETDRLIKSNPLCDYIRTFKPDELTNDAVTFLEIMMWIIRIILLPVSVMKYIRE